MRSIVTLTTVAMLVVIVCSRDTPVSSVPENVPQTDQRFDTLAPIRRMTDSAASMLNDPEKHPSRALRHTARLCALPTNARGRACDLDLEFAKSQWDVRRVANDRVNNKKRPQIAILTFSGTQTNAAFHGMEHPTRTASFGQSQWNHRQYALKHGYDFLWDDPSTAIATNRTLHWAKLVAIARWAPHYDWILWTDADTLFYNFNITVEAILATHSDWGRRIDMGIAAELPRLFIAKDATTVNTGVILMKGKDADVLEFLSMVYHYPNATLEPGHTFRRWEQGPFSTLLTAAAAESRYTIASGWAKVLPSRLFNARPAEWWPVKLDVATPSDSLVMHLPCLWCAVPQTGKPFFGAMGFTRAYTLTANAFESDDAAAVEPGCVFQSPMHLFWSTFETASSVLTNLRVPSIENQGALKRIENARVTKR